MLPCPFRNRRSQDSFDKFSSVRIPQVQRIDAVFWHFGSCGSDHHTVAGPCQRVSGVGASKLRNLSQLPPGVRVPDSDEASKVAKRCELRSIGTPGNCLEVVFERKAL